MRRKNYEIVPKSFFYFLFILVIFLGLYSFLATLEILVGGIL